MIEEVNEMISNTVAEGATTQKKENIVYAAAAVGALTIMYGIVKGSKKLYKKVTGKDATDDVVNEEQEPVKSRVAKAKETFVKAAKTASSKARGPYKTRANTTKKAAASK